MRTTRAAATVVLQLSAQHAAAVEVLLHRLEHIGGLDNGPAVIKLLDYVTVAVLVALVVVKHVRVHHLHTFGINGQFLLNFPYAMPRNWTQHT